MTDGTSQTRFSEAVGLHRQGRLAQAEALYEEILKTEPDQVDVLHLLGVVALQTKRYQRAVDLIGKAIGLSPDSPEFHANYGLALRELARFDEAIASYDRAIRIRENFAEAYNNRGVALKDLKRVAEAIASYDRATAINPNFAEAYSNRGNALTELRQFTAALESYDRAIRAKPDHAKAHNNRGIALKELKRFAEAIASYDRAIAITPNFAEAHNNRGVALKELKRFAEAIASYDRAIAINSNFADAYSNRGSALNELRQFTAAIESCDRAITTKSDHAEAHNNRGIALKELERFDEAIASYDRAIAIAPDFAEAHYNRGIALKELDHPAEAIANYDRAIAIAPDFAEAFSNRGNALRDLGRIEEAVADYDRAIAIRPDHADACVNKSLLLLTAGNFREGWTLHLKRRSVRSLTPSLHREPLAQDLTGLRILLIKDQGLGDEIFFLRWAPALKRRGAHLIYRAGDKIVSMLRRLDCLDAVIGEDAAAPASDMSVSVGDLPYLLQMTSVADIPPTLRLPVLPDRLTAQQDALAALGTPPYVGVTWRAGTDRNGSLYKSAPLAEIGAALRHSGGTLIGLQRSPETGEIDALADTAGAPVHDLTALNDRLEDMLALLTQLDVYVTVSNTNVHLRAAVGKSSRVLVPVPPEFRWMASGRVSPWFPDCTVYRQGTDQSWQGALDTLAADLASS